MPNRKRRKGAPDLDQASVNWELGKRLVSEHPLFSLVMSKAYVYRDDRVDLGRDGWIALSEYGHLRTHDSRRAEPEEWAYAIAHGLLHLAFGHRAGGVGKDARAWT